MSVVFMEGFDHGLQSEKGWYYSGNNWPYNQPTFQTTTGRYGGYSVYLRDDNGSTGYKYFDSSYSTLIVGFAFYFPYDINANDFGQIGGTGIHIDRQSSKIRIRNTSGTTLGTGTLTVNYGAWYYLELKVVVHPSAGSIELRLNGTPDLIASGLNTGSSNATYIQFGPMGGMGCGNNCLMLLIDDIYVVDPTVGSAPTNNFLGDCQVKGIVPLAEGANTAWTANTGTKVSRVNDIPYDGDTGYIYSNVVNDKETFTISGASIPVGNTVYAVQTGIMARKSDPGTRQIAPVIRQGGVNYEGVTTVGLPDSYKNYLQIYDRLGPDGNAWTPTSVNDAEYGVVVKV